ncbi:ABC transporter permease [Qipengyuania sp. JC766]|uniref:MlaE family ABC transporter permease n=1 Tax=Qipengyuania sp. JC766 TaxID=3232139 RepID=UPI003459923E
MAGGAHFSFEDDGQGGEKLALKGPFLVSTIGPIDTELQGIDAEISAVDLADVTEIDTAGAWIACSIASRNDVSVINGSERAERLMAALSDVGSEAELSAPREPVFRRVPGRVGEQVVNFGKGFGGSVAFLGEVLAAFAVVLFTRPWTFRFKALVRQMELVGVSALPIVGLMSFLIGVVIAQQGASQLAQFGAETLTVNLVGRITLRELGVLMTAIMVAGRSGSAFAAQIGTMRLTEEVDAMRTIGISPIEALVLPRILAAVLMMPLLGFYAACLAIVGGAAIADVTLGIAFMTFLERIQEVVPTYDLWVGLIKAPIFGLIVALCGCYQGMQVEGDSEQVGLRTTQAVVTAIFSVIVLDAFFAVFFAEIGWM